MSPLLPCRFDIGMRLLPAVLVAAGLSAASPPARGQEVPMPVLTIYPNEIIRAEMVETRPMPYRVVGSGGIAGSLAEVVGKASRQTLLPGRPIPASAIEEPRIVRMGVQVRLVFSMGSIQISGAGTALEAGGLGERIRVRNSDSSTIVTGVIRPDGTVAVGDM